MTALGQKGQKIHPPQLRYPSFPCEPVGRSPASIFATFFSGYEGRSRLTGPRQKMGEKTNKEL